MKRPYKVPIDDRYDELMGLCEKLLKRKPNIIDTNMFWELLRERTPYAYSTLAKWIRENLLTSLVEMGRYKPMSTNKYKYERVKDR